MKAGFLSLELVFTIIILGLVFSFIMRMLVQSSTNTLDKTKVLYKMEEKLLKQVVPFTKVKLRVDGFKEVEFKLFELKKEGFLLHSIAPASNSYKAKFK